MLLTVIMAFAGAQTAGALSGSGTAADPYLISSAADWTWFASAVSDGMTYEDQTLKLTANINGITTMAGTSDHRFKGTFMGDGHTLTVNYTATGENCAPFLYIEGATINTLKVAGTISTGYKCAAGIVAHSYGDCTIQNCWSNVAITSTVSGDGTHAGLVAVHEDGSLRITNCLFDGSITGSNTTNCGGFVGWRNATLTFTNCFQNGTLSLKQTSGSATFNRNGGATLTNSYYKTAYGDVQGQQTDATGSTLRALLGSGWAVSGGKVIPIMSPTNIATATISGIAEYYVKTGQEIKPEPVVTAADGTLLTKGTHYTLSWSGDGKTDGTYTITVTGAGSYTGSQQISYVVKSSETLGGYDFQLGKDDEGLFYKISSSDDLRALATYVNAGNNASGKRFKQTADINLGGSSNPFTPIGVGKKSDESDWFAGTYDGGSYTISGLYVSYSQPSVGFFCYVDEGTVKNVILVSPDVTNTKDDSGAGLRVGALIGYTYHGTVENCLVVSPSLSATGSSDKYYGAIAGHSGSDYDIFTNCCYYTDNASLAGIGKLSRGDVSRAYKVTLGGNAGLPTPAATGGFIAQGSHYYRPGATVQLSYTGSNTNSYRPVFSVSPTNTGASVTAQGVLTMGSADITITATLSSTPLVDISTGTIADIPDQGYTGSAIVPDITLTVGDKVLTAGADYIVSCTNNVKVGTATLTATGQGDYTGTLTKSFRIYYADKTGSCGTNVTYTLHDEDQDGHYEQLTISGTGAMTPYASSNDVPWAANCKDITSATIQSGVTIIGGWAFCDCRNLTSVSLPEGLTAIGDGVFEYCYSLSSLTVPASVESIGRYSFWGLASPLTFASGSRLNSVAQDAFSYTYASVDMSACTSLTSVPDAFWYSKGDVTFPRSLTSIAEACFYGSNSKVYVDAQGYRLTVNGVTTSVTDGKADITSAIGVGTYHPAVTLACAIDPEQFAQSGDTYTIYTAGGWNVFCDALQDNTTYNRFSGKTVYLGNDISVTRMAGSKSHDFCGTFDGQGYTLTFTSTEDVNGVAPFSYVSETTPTGGSAVSHPVICKLNVVADINTKAQYASGLVGLMWGTLTIEDCTVSGTIQTSAMNAAGFIADQNGDANITDCRSSVAIKSSVEGDGTHGGFVAVNNKSTNLTIEGCVFDGKLLTTNSTTKCGGFIGWRAGTAEIRNSLFDPATPTGSETWVGNTESATFARNNVDTYNCYYTYLLCDGTNYKPQYVEATETAPAVWRNGKAACTAAAAPVGSATHAKYSVSGITPYANGLQRTVGDAITFYYGGGDNVSVSFVNENGGSGTHEATVLDGSQTGIAGWYFVGKDINSQKITLSDDATIILGDGCTMSIGTSTNRINNSCIFNNTGKGLTIYGQSGQSGTLNAYNAGNTTTVFMYHYTQHGGNVTFDGTYSDILHVRDGDLTLTRGTLNVNCISPHYAIQLDASPKSTAGALYVSGGTLNATTGNASAILGDLNMTGGTVNATGQYGIKGNVTFSGGILNATGTTTNSTAIYGIYGDATFSWTSAADRITVSRYRASNTFTIADGQAFTDGTNIYSGTLSSDDKTAIAGKTLQPVLADILTDDTNNTTTIQKLADNLPHDIMLLGRKLYKDGAWNTLCLPFSTALTGDLANADIRALSSASLSDEGVLTLNFTAEGAITSITAGQPYIVKWTGSAGQYVENPVFTNVTVSSTAPADVAFTGVAFKGTYDWQEYTTVNKSILFLGTDNMLYYPQPSGGTNPTIGAFRAYFELSGTTQARQFVLNFGDGSEDTGIVSISKESGNQGNNPEFLNSLDYYTLDGVKLDGKPTKKGLYIHGGKRVVIK